MPLLEPCLRTHTRTTKTASISMAVDRGMLVLEHRIDTHLP